MAKSTSTPPVGLDPSVLQDALEYARQQDAPAPSGYGKAALRGVPRGVFGTLGAVTDALQSLGNPMDMLVNTALRHGGYEPNPITQVGNDLANRIGPPPTAAGPQLLEAGVAGAVGGAPMGPLGAASGFVGGGTTELGTQLGLPEPVAMLLGLGAGMVPGGIANLRANRGPMGAARVLEETAALDDKTLPQALQSQPSTPGALGVDRMGRTGRAAAVRVAGEGGAPADRIVEAVTRQGEGANDRVLQTVAKVFRQRPQDPNAARRSLERLRASADARNYNDAMLNRNIPLDDEMRFLLDDPVIRRAYAQRAAVAETRVRSNPTTGRTENQPLPPLLDADGQVVRSLPIRALNEIKKGLDDLARPTAPNAKQITEAEAQAAGTRLDRIRGRLTSPDSPDYQPDYAQALAEHQSYSQAMDLIEQGMQSVDGTEIRLGPNRTVTATPEEIQRLVGEAGGKAPFFRLGQLEVIRRRGGTLDAEALKRVEAALPPGRTASDVLAAVSREAERRSTEAAVRGAGRGLRSEQDMNLERSVADVGARRYRPALRDAILSVLRRGQISRLPQPVRTRIAEVTSLPDGPAFDAAAKQLLADLAVLNSIGPTAAAASGLGATAAGTSRGSRRD